MFRAVRIPKGQSPITTCPPPTSTRSSTNNCAENNAEYQAQRCVDITSHQQSTTDPSHSPRTVPSQSVKRTHLNPTSIQAIKLLQTEQPNTPKTNQGYSRKHTRRPPPPPPPPSRRVSTDCCGAIKKSHR